jgi:hypothetical protein
MSHGAQCRRFPSVPDRATATNQRRQRNAEAARFIVAQRKPFSAKSGRHGPAQMTMQSNCNPWLSVPIRAHSWTTLFQPIYNHPFEFFDNSMLGKFLFTGSPGAIGFDRMATVAVACPGRTVGLVKHLCKH